MSKWENLISFKKIYRRCTYFLYIYFFKNHLIWLKMHLDLPFNKFHQWCIEFFSKTIIILLIFFQIKNVNFILKEFFKIYKYFFNISYYWIWPKKHFNLAILCISTMVVWRFFYHYYLFHVFPPKNSLHIFFQYFHTKI